MSDPTRRSRPRGVRLRRRCHDRRHDRRYNRRYNRPCSFTQRPPFADDATTASMN